ncbi:MAG TPA: polysaccharide biosynthesis/export family protein [Pararhizobium sp.]|nr:polysaccharide biosynthesis/export family protein [Pararhizobium sp.]
MALIALSIGVTGCQSVSTNGPLASAITDSAGQSAAERDLPNAAVFDVVDVDLRAARLVSAYRASRFNRTFGFGGSAARAVIGVGDELRITIFEAGTDGLFSTTESKQTVLDVVVQPNGKAAIPYVGEIRFAGRTLEQARQAILAGLKGKAVEPDVIVANEKPASRSVTVAGAIHASGMIPLDLKGDQITEVVAKAGGPVNPPYETYITLTRGHRSARVLLKNILENPSEDIYVHPDDQIFVTYDPRTFTALGETVKNDRIPFGADDVNLIEAIALAGGGRPSRIDARGYFIFRYEDKDVVEALIGLARFNELLAKGMAPDKYGRYPVVYHIDMDRPDSLIVGQNFPIRNHDVIYASRHPSVDIETFMRIISAPFNMTRSTLTLGSAL